MTVLVALEHARLDDVVTVTPQAAGVGESTVGLRPGERLSVRDLAIAALVPSANDAATALAVHVGRGSVARFVAMMNAKARSLGLTSTHFENPHGLDQPGHVSSARDVTTLLSAALREPVHPHVVDEVDGDDRRRPGPDLDRRADREAAARRRQDRSHGRRGLVAGRGGRARRRADHRLVARGAERGTAERRPGVAPHLGPRAVPPRPGDRRGPRLRARRDGLRSATGQARGGENRRPQRAGGQAARRARRRELGPRASGRPRPARRRGAGLRGR